MAYSLGTVQEDATIYFYFSTAAADGGEENFSATLEEADVPIHKDGSAMTLDASTITITNVATGLYKLTIDLSNDADFTAGSHYVVMIDASDETIDAQAVSAVVGTFDIETAAAKATREFQEYVFPTATLTTQTGVSDNTQVNLTGIVDAQSQDDLFNGLTGKLRDATDGQVYDVRVTDFATTNLLASIEAMDAGVTLPTPASGDQFWFTGIDPAYKNGANHTEAGGTGDHLTAVPLNSAWFSTAITEAYSTDGADASVAELLYEAVALLSEFSVSGTTVTVKQRDGSTTAMTLTLNSATDPTSTTRAS